MPHRASAPRSLLRFPDLPVGFRWRTFGLGEPLEVLASIRFPARHGFACRVLTRQADGPPLGVRDGLEGDLDLLGRAAGVRAVHAMRQVHGNDVQVLRSVERPNTPAIGDALVTRIPRTAVAIKAADCLPVLLADPVSGAVAGVHAGWRGTLARVVEAAAGALASEAGAPPSRLRAVIGPAIRSCCFEVGRRVVSLFREKGHDVDRFVLRPPAAGRPHLDLVLANRLQLVAAGLSGHAIEDTELCTRCQPVFHSYRREGPGVGRNWSVVVVG